MKPHLLYIAFWYPPSRASGVYRAIATTKEFIDAGWDVTVVSTTTDFFEDEVGSIDASLLAHIPETAAVVRVPFTFGIAPVLNVRSMTRLGANFPTLLGPIRRWSATARSVLPLPEDRSRPPRIMENYVSWIEPAVEAGMQVGERHRIDHILATGNPYSSFEAGRRLGEALGTGFSIDYRDPWTIDVFTGRSDIANRDTTRAERRIIDEAFWCFHVNQAIADAYQEKYPESAEKHQVVYNGYDAESIPGPSQSAKGPYRFGMLGTLNDRWPIAPLFEAWATARAQLPPGSELVLGGHLGYFAHSQELLQTHLPPESEGFRYLGPIAKSDVAAFYSSLDVVIVPVPGGPMVTSGKVFEALALGKPFICIQSAGGGARALADESPLAIGVEPKGESILGALLQAAEMARDLDPEESLRVRSAMARYERHKSLTPMVESITGRRSAGSPT